MGSSQYFRQGIRTLSVHGTSIPICSLAVLGLPKSGKTSLINAFLQHPHVVSIRSNVRGYTDIIYQCTDYISFVEIFDCDKSEKQSVLSFNMVRSCDAFILVYALDDPDSFEYVQTIRNEILYERREVRSSAIVVIGQKPDANCPVDKQLRIVSELVVTCDWGHVYYETSFCEEHITMQAFEDTLKSVIKKNHNYVRSGPTTNKRASLPNLKQRFTKWISKGLTRHRSNSS